MRVNFLQVFKYFNFMKLNFFLKESCKTNEKFKIRSCPKLVDCYRNNNFKFFPSAKFERQLLVRNVALEFLHKSENKNIKKENSSDEILKRFLFGSTLTEETNERRERAFEGCLF
jgi:hypothetical protein